MIKNTEEELVKPLLKVAPTTLAPTKFLNSDVHIQVRAQDETVNSTATDRQPSYSAEMSFFWEKIMWTVVCDLDLRTGPRYGQDEPLNHCANHLSVILLEGWRLKRSDKKTYDSHVTYCCSCTLFLNPLRNALQRDAKSYVCRQPP